MFFMILRVMGIVLVCASVMYAFILWARDEEKKVQVEEALHEIELTISLAKEANFNTQSLDKAKDKLKQVIRRGVRK